MFRDFGVVCIALLCVFILQVQAGGCPFAAHSPALPKQKTAKKPASNKTVDEILKERLRKIVPLTDQDKDGKSSVEELTVWTQETLSSAYKEEAEARLKQLDKDEDGKISWDEYRRSKENIGAVTEEQKKRRFNLADADEDGGLTQDEMVSMFHPEETPHMFDVVVDEYMEMGDKDNDGFISLDEYKNKMVKKGKANQKVYKQFFSQQDKDQDGKISRDEIKQWLESMNTASQAKSQAKLLVEKADDNKDGLLNEEEVMNHVNLFKVKNSEKQQTSEKATKDEL